ncbi:MarR family winged helix-turn-helix transcriptional regulator [Aurantimonas sp. A2-1-M11]|uniref:MarR family winged helix-turn-helix transcriptional regulator n=1 Tax=Aurantimonas sp. A2-1-M11 TaxID=3113712 RepID=UPI002F9400C0
MYQTSDIASAAPASSHIVVDLLRVAKLTRAYVEIATRVAGLRPGQDELIILLSAEPTRTVCQIAARLGVRPATVSKMLNCLSKKGLVEQIPDMLDHRKSAVVLTDAGVEMQALVREIWRGVEENLFGGLSDSETGEIREALELLDEQLKERLARLR